MINLVFYGFENFQIEKYLFKLTFSHCSWSQISIFQYKFVMSSDKVSIFIRKHSIIDSIHSIIISFFFTSKQIDWNSIIMCYFLLLLLSDHISDDVIFVSSCCFQINKNLLKNEKKTSKMFSKKSGWQWNANQNLYIHNRTIFKFHYEGIFLLCCRQHCLLCDLWFLNISFAHSSSYFLNYTNKISR